MARVDISMTPKSGFCEQIEEWFNLLLFCYLFHGQNPCKDKSDNSNFTSGKKYLKGLQTAKWYLKDTD